MRLKFHQRFLQRGYLAYSRLSRGMTLGVRAMLLKDDHVILVKHSYVSGWYFPGGGVEWGETLGVALGRELEEEVGVRILEAPQLHNVYANFASFPGDHIALFHVPRWERNGNYCRPREIAEAELFDRNALPDGTDPGTRARLDEIFDGGAKREIW